MEQTELNNKINDLRKQLDVEKQVSQRIRGYITKKKDVIDGMADERDKLMHKKIGELNVEKEKIRTMKEEADKEITRI